MKCFADKGRECSILYEKRCAGCAFKKSYTQFNNERKTARKRINGLPEEVKRNISAKYYYAERG